MSRTIKGMLPTITFQPSGQEAFHSLLTLMVGTHVEITHLKPKPSWEDWSDGELRRPLVFTRGEITYVTDDVIFLKPYGVPKRYKQGAHYRDHAINLTSVRMIEVIG